MKVFINRLTDNHVTEIVKALVAACSFVEPLEVKRDGELLLTTNFSIEKEKEKQ